MTARARRVGDLGALSDLVDVHASRQGVTEAHAREQLIEVPVGDLRPSPYQPPTRGTPDGDAPLADLAENIREHGVLQPLLARRLGDGALEIMAGHRRLAASRLAGLATVPVRVQQGVSDLTAQERTLAENLARTDLTPWEEAQGLAALRSARQRAGVPATQRALAKAAGWSLGRVSESLSIADRVTPDVLAAAGGDVQTVNTLPKLALLEVAREDAAAKRGPLLRRKLGPAAAAATVGADPTSDGDGTAADGPATWTARVRVDGPSRVALRVPVSDLAPDDAAGLLRALQPLLRALRARAAE